MKLRGIRNSVTEVTLDKIKVVFSYSTPVILIDHRQEIPTAYVTGKKWSVTTTRHINEYLKAEYPDAIPVKKSQEFLDDYMERIV